MVGRLVMRRRLRDEGLIPEPSFGAFLAWSRQRDERLLTRLASGSPEHRALTDFCRDPVPAPPYPDDAGKPACLLRPEAMALGGLLARPLLGRVPGLTRSLHRLRRQNRDRPAYQLLGVMLVVAVPATWLLAVLAASNGNLTILGLQRRLRHLRWVLSALVLLGVVIVRRLTLP